MSFIYILDLSLVLVCDDHAVDAALVYSAKYRSSMDN